MQVTGGPAGGAQRLVRPALDHAPAVEGDDLVDGLQAVDPGGEPDHGQARGGGQWFGGARGGGGRIQVGGGLVGHDDRDAAERRAGRGRPPPAPGTTAARPTPAAARVERLHRAAPASPGRPVAGFGAAATGMCSRPMRRRNTQYVQPW